MSDTPKRIHLSRRKGFKLPPGAVNVARPSKWGNPFKVGAIEASVPNYAMSEACGGIAMVTDEIEFHEPLSRGVAVEVYRAWLLADDCKPFRESVRVNLRGKDLACWCKPGEPCHADVLLEVANGGVP